LELVKLASNYYKVENMKTLFKNCSVMDGASPASGGLSNCMIISGDRIEYIGDVDHEHVKIMEKEPDARIVDLDSRCVLPSFIDGHMHMLLFAASLTKPSVAHCDNFHEIRETISKAAKESPDAPRLFIQGWRQPATHGAALASMIDDIDPRPIFIDAEDLHSTWCNTAALLELDVHDMQDPVGGHIHRDENGRPSGLLSESAAMTIAWPHFARVSSDEKKLACIRTGIRAYTAAGYTGVVEMAMDSGVWEALKVLRREEQVNLRIAAHWLINPSSTTEENLAQVDKAIEEHAQYNLETSPAFRIAGIKIICDGVIDACTAFLSKPYTSNNALPDPLWDASALQKVIQKADAAGLQCALHAIGDAAVTLAIDSLESLNTTGRRHRTEHLEFTRPEDARRLGTAGITASIQPVHCDPKILGAWPDLLGPERCCRAFAYREFLEHGAKLAIGTDAPTALHLPFPNIYGATTRRSARDHERLVKPVNEHFKLALGDALNAATSGAAYSCFAEGFTGRLEVGMKADFVVVDTGGDWESDLENLLHAKVLETWFEGKRVFKLGHDLG